MKDAVGGDTQRQGRARFCRREAAGVGAAEGAEARLGRVAGQALTSRWHRGKVSRRQRVCVRFASGAKP